MVVGAASAANADMAVNDVNLNALDDSNVQLNYNDDYNVIVEVNNITQGQDEIIKVTVTKDGGRLNREAYVTFQVDNAKAVSKVLDRNGKANYTVNNLGVGDHKVTVKFYSDGDDRNPNIVTKTFNVKSIVKPTTVTLKYVKDIDEGKTNTISADATPDIWGKYIFSIDGKKVQEGPNNQYTIPKNLSVGPHSVSVEFIPWNTSYNKSSDFKTFNVNATVKPTTVNLTNVKDIEKDKTNTVTAVVFPTVSGNYKFFVDGYQVKSGVDNKLVIDTKYLSVGPHSVSVEFTPWDKSYTKSSDFKTFNVNAIVPVNTTVDIYGVKDLKVGDSTQIWATENPETRGFFTYFIDGEQISPDRSGRYYIPGTLAANEHTVTVKFNPFDTTHFNPSEKTVAFNVTKYDMGLNVTAEVGDNDTHIIGGNDVNVFAQLFPNTPFFVYLPVGDTVLFSLDNETWFEAPIYPWGYGLFTNNTFEALAAGVYDYFVKYPGNDYFNEKVITGQFTINQAVPEINVTATPEESTYITLDGNTVTITATLPVDATGNAKIVVWREGDEGAHEYEVPIENGVATLVLDNLVAGNYNYQVYYAGDVNYTENDNNGSFVINKADPELILEVFGEHPNVKKDGSNQDFGVYVKDNIFFFANLPADATGYVYFSLDGIVWYKAPVVDGKAQYEFGELPAGEYTLYAYYTGDDNYNSAYSNTTFTVESPSPYVHEEPVVPTMANTGNPLLVLFIALAGLGIGSLRRKL